MPIHRIASGVSAVTILTLVYLVTAGRDRRSTARSNSPHMRPGLTFGHASVRSAWPICLCCWWRSGIAAAARQARGRAPGAGMGNPAVFVGALVLLGVG